MKKPFIEKRNHRHDFFELDLRTGLSALSMFFAFFVLHANGVHSKDVGIRPSSAIESEFERQGSENRSLKLTVRGTVVDGTGQPPCQVPV